MRQAKVKGTARVFAMQLCKTRHVKRNPLIVPVKPILSWF